MKSYLNLLKQLVLFVIGGSIYIDIELLWRGHTHSSMFFLGGLCFVCCGLLNEYISWEMRLHYQMLLGTAIVTVLEFIAGCILNLWLGLNVWDYSELPYNLLGQICVPYCLLWIPLVLLAILLDDWVRWRFFGEDEPRYRF